VETVSNSKAGREERGERRRRRGERNRAPAPSSFLPSFISDVEAGEGGGVERESSHEAIYREVREEGPGLPE